MCNSVNFTVLTEMHSCHFYLILQYFISPLQKILYTLAVIPCSFILSPIPGSHWSIVYFSDFAILNISYN